VNPKKKIEKTKESIYMFIHLEFEGENSSARMVDLLLGK